MDCRDTLIVQQDHDSVNWPRDARCGGRMRLSSAATSDLHNAREARPKGSPARAGSRIADELQRRSAWPLPSSLLHLLADFRGRTERFRCRGTVWGRSEVGLRSASIRISRCTHRPAAAGNRRRRESGRRRTSPGHWHQRRRSELIEVQGAAGKAAGRRQLAGFGLQRSLVDIGHAFQLGLTGLDGQLFGQLIGLERSVGLRGTRLAIRHAQHDGDDSVGRWTILRAAAARLFEKRVVVEPPRRVPCPRDPVRRRCTDVRVDWLGVDGEGLIPVAQRLVGMAAAQCQQSAIDEQIRHLSGVSLSDASVRVNASS